MFRFKSLIPLLLFSLLLIACSPDSNEPTGNTLDSDSSSSTDDEAEQDAPAGDALLVAAVGDFSAEHLCSQGFDLGFADLDAAAQTPTMNPDFSAGTLGLAGAESLVASFFSPKNTFCGIDLPVEAQVKLEKIDQLIGDGNLSEARNLVEELFQELLSETGQTRSVHVRTSLALQLNKQQTYHFVKTFLSSAARFQVLGMDDLAQDAIEKAQDTFSEWAEAALENITDIKELLGIAAQSQLLGLLNDLDQDAIEKAAELAEQKVQDLLQSFNPCNANEGQIREILGALALSQALGGGDQGSTDSVLKMFETARRNNSAKAKGESLPECEGAWIVEVKSNTGGLAIDFSVRSCDGINWEGVHTQKGSMLGGAAIIDLSAMFEFTTPDGADSPTISSGVVTYDSAGTWTVAGGGDSVAATISNGFSFSVELDRLNSSAIVDIVSTGGTMNLEGQSVSFPQLFGPGEDITAMVSVNEACSN